MRERERAFFPSIFASSFVIENKNKYKKKKTLPSSFFFLKKKNPPLNHFLHEERRKKNPLRVSLFFISIPIFIS